MTSRVVIVDYKMGNVGSILNMLKYIGISALVSSDPAEIDGADQLVLPGVGAFDAGMDAIRAMGLIKVLEKKAMHDRIPILGICLGMQLITRRSEEGTQQGLAWVQADTVRFRSPLNEDVLRIPHVGWNSFRPLRPDRLFSGMESGGRAYFVHSFHVRCDSEADVIATTHYGDDFPSIIRNDNVVGMQFHAEKSHKYGMQLFRNFFGT